MVKGYFTIRALGSVAHMSQELLECKDFLAPWASLHAFLCTYCGALSISMKRSVSFKSLIKLGFALKIK